MKKVKDYSDFIIDSLFESIGTQGVLPFVFSREFEILLQGISHPIANDLLNNENQNHPVTLIDVTDKNDLVSFATSPKIIEFLMDANNKPKEEVMGVDFYKYLRTDRKLLSTKYRSTIKIGKLIKKIFDDKYPDNGKPGQDIESFVNIYKSVFDKDDIMDLFELENGEDIPKWYSTNRYADNGRDSELYNSCMNDEEDFLRFYAINRDHVKILVLYENDRKSKIVGRALVWNLDEPENRIFMDRVYTIHNYQVDFFKEYAKRNGWLYKSVQSYGNQSIVDTRLDNGENHITLTIRDIKLADEYPYMDTLRYLDQDKNILSNDRISDVKLIDTSGEAYDCKWNNRYNRWINMYNVGSNGYVICELSEDRWGESIDKVYKKEDAVYIPRYGEWISKEKYKTDIVKTTVGTVREILKKDAIELKHYNGWAEETYADSIMKYSELDDDYYTNEDAVYSKWMESWILKDNAIEVYEDKTKTKTDWIPKDRLKKDTTTENGDYILINSSNS